MLSSSAFIESLGAMGIFLGAWTDGVQRDQGLYDTGHGISNPIETLSVLTIMRSSLLRIMTVSLSDYWQGWNNSVLLVQTFVMTPIQ